MQVVDMQTLEFGKVFVEHSDMYDTPQPYCPPPSHVLPPQPARTKYIPRLFSSALHMSLVEHVTCCIARDASVGGEMVRSNEAGSTFHVSRLLQRRYLAHNDL